MQNKFQRTAEWFDARVGKLTASRAAAAFATSKRDGKPLQSALDVIAEIACERITGQAIEHFTSGAMEWGIEHEDEALRAYEVETGELVDQVGFIEHPTVKHLGASPDGLVGNDGLIEIKCPNSMTHMRRCLEGVVPEEYKPQMLLQMLCTGRRWCDFVDYDPRFKAQRLFIVRFEPTKQELDDAMAKAVNVLGQVDALVAKFGGEHAA